MQMTFKLFVSCLFCLSLLLVSGCGGDGNATGGGNDSTAESVPALTPIEKTEADEYVAKHKRDVILRYLENYVDDEEMRKNSDAKRVIVFLNYFISQGANVNAQDDDGMSPLHWAVVIADVEVVKFLVSKGANIKAKTDNGTTPLHIAAGLGKVEIVKYLVSKGADVNAKGDGGTPLEWAGERDMAGAPNDEETQKGKKEVVDFLSNLK